MAIICEQCGKSLASSTTLKNHIQAVHEKVRKHVCPICDKAFFDRGKLKFHQHKHSEVRNFHCDECGRSFKTRSDLYQHFEIHDKGKTFTCQECGLEVAKRSTYEAHIRLEHKEQCESICKYCNRNFQNAGHLRRHIASVHERSADYPCSICSKTFTRKDTMKKHELTHLKHSNLWKNSKLEPDDEDSTNKLLSKFQCEICKESFFTRIDLTKHQQVKHNLVQLHKCEECPEEFEEPNDLYLHYKIVHDAGKTFKCENCSLEFKKRSTYDVHMRRLKDLGKCYENPYKVRSPKNEADGKFTCTICFKIYKTLDYLRKHRKRVHQQIKNFVCLLCPESAFVHLNELKKHQLLKHTIKTSFVCEDCGQGFKIKSELYKHFEIHDKGKTFSCSLCQLEFPKRSTYEMHLRRHEIIKSRTCEVCGDVSKNIKTFERHMRLAHRREIKIYDCDRCCKSFGRKSAIEQHMISHGGPEMVKSEKIFGRKRGRPKKVVINDLESSIESMVGKDVCPSKIDEGPEDIVVKCELPEALGTDITNNYQDQEDLGLPGFEELLLQPFVKDEPAEIKEEIFSEDEVTNPIDAGYSDDSQNSELMEIRAVFKVEIDDVNNALEDISSKSKKSEKFKKKSRKSFDCSTCEKTYHSRKNLKFHQYAVHDIGEPSCKSEKEEDSDNSSVKSEKSDSSLGKNPMVACQCHICGQEFTNRGTLRQHRYRKHNSNGVLKRAITKIYNCEDCGNTYHSRQNLNFHKKAVHEKKMNFACKICNLSFGWQRSLKRHNDSHHKDTANDEQEEDQELSEDDIKQETGNLVACQCHICGQEFTNRGTLRQHRFRKHNANGPPKRAITKNFNCDSCGNTYHSRQNLNFHQRAVHEKKMDFVCEICNLSFGWQRSLKRHNDSHHKDTANEDPEEDQELSEDDIKQETGNSVSCQCHICGQQFNNKNTLRQHRFRKHKPKSDEKVQCEICQLAFNSKDSLQQHKYRKHNKNGTPPVAKNKSSVKPFICPQCGNSYHSRQNMEDHQAAVHEKRKDFLCSICNISFAWRKSLKSHIELKHGRPALTPGDISLHCSFCEETFETREILKTHCGLVHGKLIPIDCNFCQHSFTSKRTLRVHQVTVHGMVESAQFACGECDSVFTLKTSLSRHQIEKHEIRKDFKCDLCEEEFLRRRQRIKHMKVVHEGGSKITRDCGVCFIKFTLASEFFAHISGHSDHFICQICGQNCEDEFALRLHKSTHRKVDEEEKKVVCDTCGLRFLQKSLLKIHLRQHSGEKCFTCDECGKSFKFPSSLCVHKKSHNKEFECTYCKRKCATRQALELHVNTHTGLKPYACDVCDARFGAPNSLIIHKRKHTGEKKYTCHLCPSAYSFNSSLKNHLMKQHGVQQATLRINPGNSGIIKDDLFSEEVSDLVI